jgi:hypothetical protein
MNSLSESVHALWLVAPLTKAALVLPCPAGLVPRRACHPATMESRPPKCLPTGPSNSPPHSLRRRLRCHRGCSLITVALPARNRDLRQRPPGLTGSGPATRWPPRSWPLARLSGRRRTRRELGLSRRGNHSGRGGGGGCGGDRAPWRPIDVTQCSSDSDDGGGPAVSRRFLPWSERPAGAFGAGVPIPARSCRGSTRLGLPEPGLATTLGAGRACYVTPGGVRLRGDARRCRRYR